MVLTDRANQAIRKSARKEAENINGKRKLNSAGVAAQFEILGENLDTCSKRNNNNNGIVYRRG